jgi:hypothetical protein
VVGTDVGGLGAMIRDGWKGYLPAPEAGPDAWADLLLRRLIHDPSLRNRMGANACQPAERDLSMVAFTERIEQALSGLGLPARIRQPSTFSLKTQPSWWKRLGTSVGFIGEYAPRVAARWEHLDRCDAEDVHAPPRPLRQSS